MNESLTSKLTALIVLMCVGVVISYATMFFYPVYGSSISMVQEDEPIILSLDGNPVGTVESFKYFPVQKEMYIVTNEILLNCRTDRIFRDRFEDN